MQQSTWLSRSLHKVFDHSARRTADQKWDLQYNPTPFRASKSCALYARKVDTDVNNYKSDIQEIWLLQDVRQKKCENCASAASHCSYLHSKRPAINKAG